MVGLIVWIHVRKFEDQFGLGMPSIFGSERGRYPFPGDALGLSLPRIILHWRENKLSY